MIALIGSHGTGKTTLLEAFKRVRPEYVVTDGSSRLVRRFNDEIGTKLSKRDEQLLINRISDVQWPNEVGAELLIQTRTPLDHYAYSKALGYDDYAEERLELFKGSNHRAVKFFYIPIEFEPADDGVRYLGREFQEEIDESLKKLISAFDIPAITLTGSVENRLQKLLKHI